MNRYIDGPSIHLCTLFDVNFLAQGLALFESIESNTLANISWTVLALDDETERLLRNLQRENIAIISFHDFPDDELKSLVGIRPWREICWTSAACLLTYCLNQKDTFDFLGYIDADCFFFGDIIQMLNEIPPEKDFAIHEHNFSEDRLEWLNKSGRFNVGVVIGRREKEYVACIESWRTQVLERCDVDMLAGRCGDQTYLNDWPSQFSKLHIFQSIGVGVAPWNINNYVFSEVQGSILVNKSAVYFFHFHSLQIRKLNRFIYLFVPAAGYEFRYTPTKEIYRPYLRELNRSATQGAPIRKFNLAEDAKWLFKNGLKGKLRFFLTGERLWYICHCQLFRA